MHVTRTETGRVRMQGDAWSSEFDEDRRASWALWYAKMAADYGRRGYRDAAEALAGLDPKVELPRDEEGDG